MLIRSIVVKIEYRFDAGSTMPKWRALRGRVMVTDAAGHVTYGSDLFSPTITSIDMAIAKSLSMLHYVETVTFIFGENMVNSGGAFGKGRNLALPNRVFKNGRYIGEKMVS